MSSPYTMSIEMEDKNMRTPMIPDSITILGQTFAMPLLALALFMAAVLLSKPVCEMYSKKMCKIPRFLPKFR